LGQVVLGQVVLGQVVLGQGQRGAGDVLAQMRDGGGTRRCRFFFGRSGS
jgi:hypothetical protein